MDAGFSVFDYVVFISYAFLIVGMGLYVSRQKKGTQKTSQDYFLADRSLPWWAVGASLIAANISAEHFIAMSGSGFRIGLGIAAYEWIAAITLILVAKYFLPSFIDKKISTMPQFLETRYNRGVSMAFAIFWLLVYVFVNLTSVAWLGALAMEAVIGIPVVYGLISLCLIAGLYSVWGGLKAVAWTDVVQVIFLVGGGLVTTFIALNAVSGGEGIFAGLAVLVDKAPQLFNMIIPEGTMVSDGGSGMKDAYQDLPGIAVIFGAMWLANLGYWGFNQYIIQKGLAAKSLTEAKRGLLFAGYLKLIIPMLVIIPGITAFVLAQNPELAYGMSVSGTVTKADQAYPWLLHNFVPAGVKGLAFAALIAAVVSSLASMINSTSTIFTLDLYRHLKKVEPTDGELVKVGRWVAFIALFVAMIAAKPLLGGLDQAFQYIQEYTGYLYPGVVVVFGMGLFWKQASSRAAMVTAIITIPLGILIKIMEPEMPFILRMGYVFIVLVAVAVAVTFSDHSDRVESKTDKNVSLKSVWFLLFAGVAALIAGFAGSLGFPGYGLDSALMLGVLFLFLGGILWWNVKTPFKSEKALNIPHGLYKTDWIFNLGAAGIVLIVSLLYAVFW